MPKKHISISLIVRIAVIFVASYVISAVLWIQVKDSYAYLVTFIASKFVEVVKDAQLEVITMSKDAIHTSFRSLTGNQSLLHPVSINTYVYTSNVPMTVAVLASLYLFIQRKARALTEALLILFTIHLFYVLSYVSLQLTLTFMTKKIEGFSPIKVTVYQFLWAFTEYMFVRFGPFLIGIYIYMRFQKTSRKDI